MPAPNLRSLARSLGLSRTTVSDALRGSPRVNVDTVKRVREAAEQAGYTRNPLTSTVMSLLRRSRGQQYREVLAAIEVVDPGRAPYSIRYNAALLAGISKRATELGFQVERFELGEQGLRVNRLDNILYTRRIRGMVVLPASGFPDLSQFNWQRYTAVYADYYIDHPPLHCVCSDHYRSMVSLLKELHARGYRRPGLMIEISHDERLQYRWEGAFLALQKYLPSITEIPALRTACVAEEEFIAWFKKYDPDVVIAHHADVIGWMKKCGARITQDHAFVCLNSLRTTEPCAALDLQVSELGARAAELAIGQLLHNEFGVPIQPSLTTISAKLLEGPTLKPLKAPRKKKVEAS